MKTLLRVLAVSVFLTALGVIAGTAQETTDPCPDLEQCFAKYRELRKKPCGGRDEAVAIGKHIAEKYKTDEENKDLVERIRVDSLKIEEEDRICKRENAYNEAWKAKNWDKFIMVSKEFLNDPKTEKPLNLDVTLTLVTVGYNLTDVDKNDKYNNDTIMYAKSAIQMMDAGVVSKTGKYGVYAGFIKKEDAMGWMNFIIGYILYEKQGATMADKKKEALPFLFKATQVGETKVNPDIYYTLGEWYAGEAITIFNEYTKIREANNKVDNDEAKAKLALARGYAERAMDAYARSHKLAVAAKESQQFINFLSAEVTKYYKFRFNGKETGQTEFVTDLMAKPMPDPTSSVAPVVLEETTTTTTTTNLNTTTNVKPTSTTTGRTTTEPTKTTTKTTPKTTPKSTPKTTPVKKPATKKKGTR